MRRSDALKSITESNSFTYGNCKFTVVSGGPVGCNDDLECLFDDGVPRACIEGSCEPVECVEPVFPCPAGLSCQGFTCVPDEPECFSDEECFDVMGAPAICDEGRCVEVECVFDGQCPPNFTCDLETNSCQLAVECVRNTDCRPGEICQDGQCVEEVGDCLRDNECGADQICEENACVAPSGCAVETDCGDDSFECVAGNCIPRPTCNNDNDCSFGIPGVVCSADGFCEALVGFCNVDNDCPGSQSCVFGLCFDVGNPECIRDNQCSDNQICESGLCR